MAGDPGDLKPQFERADANAASGAIDPLAGLARQNIYLFRGYNDAVVSRAVTDATERFYRHYLGPDAAKALFYQTVIGAGHSYVVGEDREPGLGSCIVNEPPYIDRCADYDQAGIVLQHIYGLLNPPSAQLGGRFIRFDQSLYTGDDIPGALSLADQGYAYVPKDCAAGAACRVHIALHGCKQDAAEIKQLFVRHAGYDRWADSNRLIILYPQTESSPFAPFNPEACWDWWGYVTLSNDYVTKSGRQIASIKRMLDALTAGAGQNDAGVAAAPFAAAMIDASDQGADLAWRAVAGAQSYEVARGLTGQDVAVIGKTMALVFADGGLKPQQNYVWRITARGAGGESLGVAETGGATRIAPPPCAKPGACAWPPAVAGGQ